MDTKILTTALTTARCADSPDEAAFVGWLINRLPVTAIDCAGNIIVDLRTQPYHTSMFTAHTDTVHNVDDPAPTIVEDKDKGTISLSPKSDARCLGADDGAGIALLCHMIGAGVPGLYVFFRGEECGGIGSSYMAKHGQAWTAGIDRCVSFDRAGYYDVITHQGGARCCSDAFAQALAQALTTDDMTLAFAPCDTGVFTDSANLTGVVPECTNLSVGYDKQHSRNETQDVAFLMLLAQRCCEVAWDALPTKRDPKASKKWGDWDDWSGAGASGTTTGLTDIDITMHLRYALEDIVYYKDSSSLYHLYEDWCEENDMLPDAQHLRKVEKQAKKYLKNSVFDANVLFDQG